MLGSPFSVGELDLLSFFAVEPRVVGPDLVWAYNESVYEVLNGSRQLTFRIEPADRMLSVVLDVDTDVLYECQVNMVRDIRVHRDKGRKSLEIVVSPDHSVWITIAPTICVRQQVVGVP